MVIRMGRGWGQGISIVLFGAAVLLASCADSGPTGGDSDAASATTDSDGGTVTKPGSSTADPDSPTTEEVVASPTTNDPGSSTTVETVVDPTDEGATCDGYMPTLDDLANILAAFARDEPNIFYLGSCDGSVVVQSGPITSGATPFCRTIVSDSGDEALVESTGAAAADAGSCPLGRFAVSSTETVPHPLITFLLLKARSLAFSKVGRW